jgi:phospholipid transport system transporter-binding protein
MLLKRKRIEKGQARMSPLRFDPQGRTGEFLLTGEMTFRTSAPAIREAASIIDAAYTPLQFDLSGVSRADSAGVGLLIEWQRLAARARCELRYTNMPKSLESIMRVTGVLGMLPAD